MKTTITVNDIMDHNPCLDYPRERIEKLFGTRAQATLPEVLEAPIPAKDKIWICCWVLEHEAHELACRFAEYVLNKERAAGREPDPRSWAAIDAKRAWLRAWIDDAALAKAWEEARLVAWQVALTTAARGAWDVAWAAMRVAPRAAARVAAWGASEDLLEITRKYLDELTHE